MTSVNKTYWIRKKGSVGPNFPNGRCLGRGINAKQGKYQWLEKPALFSPMAGGPAMDEFLAKAGNEDCEAVEVVQKGFRYYHKRKLINWEPVS